MAAGLLNALGQRRPAWSGQGQLLREARSEAMLRADPVTRPLLADPVSPGMTGLALLTLYAAVSALEHLIRLPAPLIMLLFAVLLKMATLVPASMEHSAQWIYRFFAQTCTHPLIFCIGVVMPPWKPLVEAFSPAICITIVCTVATLALTGFLLGPGFACARWRPASSWPAMPASAATSRYSGRVSGWN